MCDCAVRGRDGRSRRCRNRRREITGVAVKYRTIIYENILG